MAEDAARLTEAEATISHLQQQLQDQQQQQQEQPAAAAAAVLSGGSPRSRGGSVDEDLVAELEDRLLEAEQVIFWQYPLCHV